MKFKVLGLLILLAVNLLPVHSHASDYSIGIGIGRPFGVGGVNGAYSINDNVQLALGLGSGSLLYAGKINYSLGLNYFLGKKGDTWRKRFGLNYNEYQENGLQVQRYDSEGMLRDSTASESRFKGIEFDFGITRLFGRKRNQSWEFGTTIPLIKEKTEDDELWGEETYTSDDDGVHIHLEFYVGYRYHFS